MSWLLASYITLSYPSQPFLQTPTRVAHDPNTNNIILKMDTPGIVGLTLCGVGVIAVSIAMIYHNDPDRRFMQTAESRSEAGIPYSSSLIWRSSSDDGRTGAFSNYGTMWRSDLRDSD